MDVCPKNGCKITPCCVFPLFFFYARIEVAFILKLSVRVMELPCISYALKGLRFLGLSAGGFPVAVAMAVLASLEKDVFAQLDVHCNRLLHS